MRWVSLEQGGAPRDENLILAAVSLERPDLLLGYCVMRSREGQGRWGLG